MKMEIFTIFLMEKKTYNKNLDHIKELLNWKIYQILTCMKTLPFLTRGWLCKSLPGGSINKSGTISSFWTYSKHKPALGHIQNDPQREKHDSKIDDASHLEGLGGMFTWETMSSHQNYVTDTMTSVPDKDRKDPTWLCVKTCQFGRTNEYRNGPALKQRKAIWKNKQLPISNNEHLNCLSQSTKLSKVVLTKTLENYCPPMFWLRLEKTIVLQCVGNVSYKLMEVTMFCFPNSWKADSTSNFRVFTRTKRGFETSATEIINQI